MGYIRIESSRAGRHLLRHYVAGGIGEAYDAGMPDARSNKGAAEGHREGAPGSAPSGQPPMPEPE